MGNLSKLSESISLGAMSGFMGYGSFGKLSIHTATFKEVLNKQLMNNPEITEEIYQQSIELSNNLTSGDYITGLAFAGAAGALGILAIYNIFRED